MSTFIRDDDGEANALQKVATGCCAICCCCCWMMPCCWPCMAPRYSCCPAAAVAIGGAEGGATAAAIGAVGTAAAGAGALTRIFIPPRAFCGHEICIMWPLCDAIV